MNTVPEPSIGGDSKPPVDANESGPLGDDYEPRVWFLTDGLCPLALDLSRKLIGNGDYVVLGVLPDELSGPRGDGLKELLVDGETEMGSASPSSSNDGQRSSQRQQIKIVPMDASRPSQAQSAIAEVVKLFGRIDILVVCRSEALVGTIEELSQSSRTRSLIREQFETTFFSTVNVIKSVLPLMRKARNGHIIVLTGITAHLGTPGLGIYCASQWAIEGYCDSLAYEIAPFNIKLTIVQPNLEVGVLTNKITSVPPLQQYSRAANQAPLARDILSGLIRGISSETESSETQSLKSSTVSSIYPQIPKSMESGLLAETVHALSVVGGHDNPPARLIIGFEGVESVKEKLKTVSEELEDFFEVSEQVDIVRVGQSGLAD